MCLIFWKNTSEIQGGNGSKKYSGGWCFKGEFFCLNNKDTQSTYPVWEIYQDSTVSHGQWIALVTEFAKALKETSKGTLTPWIAKFYRTVQKSGLPEKLSVYLNKNVTQMFCFVFGTKRRQGNVSGISDKIAESSIEMINKWPKNKGVSYKYQENCSTLTYQYVNFCHSIRQILPKSI